MGVNLDNSDSDPRGVPIIAPPAGPAAAAGLQEGDLITSIDAQPTPTYVLLKRALTQKAAGDTALIGFLRDARQDETALMLVRREELNPSAATQPASIPADQP